MRRRPSRLFLFVLVLPLGGVAAGACADDETPTSGSEPPTSVLPATDSGGTDPESDADDASCDDGGDACASPPIDCATTDFCRVTSPLPATGSLNAVWGSSAHDVWAVGTNGTILHGDGVSFTNVPSGTTAPLYSVWGTSPDDVWVAPSRAPLHATTLTDGGRTWTPMQGETWVDGLDNDGRTWVVWGTSTSDVRMAGLASSRFGGYGSFWSKGTSPEGGLVWNVLDAEELGSPVANAEVRAMWGSGPNVAWAVGAGGRAFRYEPKADASPAHWSSRNSGTVQTLEAVWGSSGSDVWAVGAEGVIRHLASADAAGFDVVASPTTRGLHGVWGSSASDVWAIGDKATLLHFDGKAWSIADAGLPVGATPDLFGIWGSGPDDVWIVGEGLILHRTKTNRRHP